jgi:hypothetical protein
MDFPVTSIRDVTGITASWREADGGMQHPDDRRGGRSGMKGAAAGPSRVRRVVPH